MSVAQHVASYNLYKDQKKAAKNLDEWNFTQDARASQELAMQQAYSRRAPGSAFTEEQIRRNQANQVSNALRMFGGDANKVAAISSSANAQANDATARLQSQGQAFSEDAFRRLSQANRDISQGRLQYRAAKNALLTSAQQNYYNAIPGLLN